MNAKVLSAGFFVLAGLLVTSSPAFSQQSPPDSAQAKQIVALVQKAAALIDSQCPLACRSAFSEFRKSGGEWRTGDTYLFVSDMKGIALFNAGFPELEGSDVGNLKDANGKLIHAALMKAAQTKGAGWVDYMWPKPGQTQPVQKWSYVKAVMFDGAPAYIGAGFYPE
jgi:signal transduction histidine kinase